MVFDLFFYCVTVKTIYSVDLVMTVRCLKRRRTKITNLDSGRPFSLAVSYSSKFCLEVPDAVCFGIQVTKRMSCFVCVKAGARGS